MAFLAGKRVAIAGAGVGGTAFALALEQACSARGVNPLPVIKIFERDASPIARESLGYSFTLDSEGDNGGLTVVRRLGRGIMEELERLQEPGGAAHICYQNFQPLIRVCPPKGKAREPQQPFEVMRIMRSRLRQALLAKVPLESLHFGNACISACPATSKGQHVLLTLSDGSSEECDLLVVADGARSKLRASLLPDESQNIKEHGACMLFGRTRVLEQLPPEIRKGHYLVLGPSSTSLFIGSVDRNTVIWALTSLAPKSRAAELNATFQDPVAAQAFLDLEVPRIAQAGGFSSEPLLDQLLCDTEASSLTAFSTIDKYPHAVREDGVAYIGDAWHPVSPFAGAGANMALQDAWELAEELVIGDHRDASAAVTAFASKSAQRSVDAVNANRRNIALAHSSGWTKQLLVTALRCAGFVMRATGLPRLATQGDHK